MKSRVENRNLRHIRQHAHAFFQAGQVRRIVQGCNRDQFPDGLQDMLVNIFSGNASVEEATASASEQITSLLNG